MRPAFSRKATYFWFVVICVGFIVRDDTLGVTSIVRALGRRCYLTLDAYFAAASVFTTARKGLLDGEPLIHILARAKKTAVGYLPAPPNRRQGPGRHKKYGRKIRLYDLFDKKKSAYSFSTATAVVYEKTEIIRYLALNLLSVYVVFEKFQGKAGDIS